MNLSFEICIAFLIESIARFLRVLMAVSLQREALLTTVFRFMIPIFNTV